MTRITHRVAVAAALGALLLVPPVAAKVVFLANGTGPTDFYWFDSAVLEARFLKTFESADKVHALAFCPDRRRGSNLVGLGKENGVIFEVDFDTLDETVLGELPAERVGGVVLLTCDRDGNLFLADQSTEELYGLDLATCQPTCAPSLVGVVETAPGAADIDVEGGDIHIDEAGTLYLVSNLDAGEANVFEIDKETALATPVATLDAAGWLIGTSWWADDRVAALADDDLIYWSELDGSDGGIIGSLEAPGGGVLDLTSGDLARPVSFDSEVSVAVAPTEPRLGESVTYELFFRQMEIERTDLRFQIWVEDAAGNPITPFLRSGRVEVRYLDELSYDGSFTVPLSVAPGIYTMFFEVWGSAQGTLRATAEFEVVP